MRCLLRSPLVPSERTSPVGWLQSALAVPVREERYVGLLRVPSRSRGVGVGSSVLGQVFRSERPPVGGWCPKRVLRSERWAEEVDERALVLLGRPSGRGPGCPSGPLFFRLLGCPMNYVLFSWAEPWRGSRSPRDPGFMNPTGAPEPPGDLSRIVRGIFVLLTGARERTRGCSPRAPGWFGQNRLGGFLHCQRGRFFCCSASARERTRGCSPQAPGRFGQNRLGGIWFSRRVCVFLV